MVYHTDLQDKNSFINAKYISYPLQTEFHSFNILLKLLGNDQGCSANKKKFVSGC